MATDPDRRHRHALGVDFGTSNTVAVARWPDGRARPILIDGSPLLPSAVYAQPDGQLIVGRDAVHSARLDPARFEPNPKRRVDDGTVLLGDREVPVGDLFAAVLARVAEEWHRTVGPVQPDVTLTCPATWGATRRTLLARAAASAGLHDARLVAEPVAAATYFAKVLGRDVPIGSVVVVHDFGAGTFDASVVARTAEGFEVLAVDGRDDIGGLDVDAAVVEHLGRLCAERDAQAWQRLSQPETVEQRRAQRQLWDDVRVAKERLSRTQSADLVVPLLEAEMHLTRDELEALAGPVLSQTVQVTQAVLRWVDLAEGRLAGVFLVGGASRIPLVATMLHRALGEAPVVIEQPELVVAEGSILAEAALLASEPAAPGLTAEMRLISATHLTAQSRSGPPPTLQSRSGLPPTLQSPSGLPPTLQSPSGLPPTLQSRSGLPPTLQSRSGLPPTLQSPSGPSSTLQSPAAESLTVQSPAPPLPPGAVTVALTVPNGRDPAPDEDRMPPAVDPWPHARDEAQVFDEDQPDMQRTQATSPAGRADIPAPPAGPTVVSPTAVTPSSPASPRSSARAPVSPARAPVSPARAPVSPARAPVSPARAPVSPARAPVPPARTPGSSARAPVSPARPPVSSARTPASANRPFIPAARQPVSPAAPASGRPARAATRPASAPPSSAARARRRRGSGFVRFLQVMISLAVLTAVPVVAMLLAYGYGNGDSLGTDTINLLRDLARLIS